MDPAAGMAGVQAEITELKAKIKKIEEEIEKVEEKLRPLEDKALNDRSKEEKAEIARLSKREGQLRDDKKQLRDDKKQLRDKESDLRDKEKQLQGSNAAIKSLLNDGFPPMSCVPTVTDAMSSSSNHLSASVEAGKFSKHVKLPDLPTNAYTSSLWLSFNKLGREELPLTTEAGLSSWVEMLMADLLYEMGVLSMLNIVREKKGFSWEPDLTICAGTNPIGGIEVKKDLFWPEDGFVAGEVFDQLMHFKHHWGIAAPFVILTSYTKWRVFWLDDQQSKGQAEKECELNVRSPGLPETPVKRRSTMESPASSPEHHHDGKVNIGEVCCLFVCFFFLSISLYLLLFKRPQKTAFNSHARKVFATELVTIEDKSKCYKLIVAAVAKMMQARPRRRSNPFEGILLRHLVVLQQNSYVWKPMKPNFEEPKWTEMPKPNTKHFFVVKSFASSKRSRVFLGCTGGGAVCVIKFLRDNGLIEVFFLGFELIILNLLFNRSQRRER